jgi:hypothetical protein
LAKATKGRREIAAENHKRQYPNAKKWGKPNHLLPPISAKNSIRG